MSSQPENRELPLQRTGPAVFRLKGSTNEGWAIRPYIVSDNSTPESSAPRNKGLGPRSLTVKITTR